jgi:hypothetical protein
MYLLGVVHGSHTWTTRADGSRNALPPIAAPTRAQKAAVIGVMMGGG